MANSGIDYPFIEGGYFMTSEQEAAAKWKIVEDYKETKARLTALRAKIAGWGETFSRIGEIVQRDQEGIGVGQITQFPTQDDYGRAAKEIKELALRFQNLEQQLRNLGVEPF